jgi:hypothetical protein
MKLHEFDHEALQKLARRPCVYTIHVVDSSGVTIDVNRLRGTDTSGIMYIGRSSNAAGRLQGFWKRQHKAIDVLRQQPFANDVSVLVL